VYYTSEVLHDAKTRSWVLLDSGITAQRAAIDICTISISN
jgi:hypothetical protein